MTPRNTVLILLLGALAGCDIISSEKFVAPSADSVDLASHNGMLWTVPGNTVLNDQTMGPSENLLYLLVICPGLSASGRGSSTEYQQKFNAYSSLWKTQKGEVSVKVSWNKRADTVSIGKQEFKREAGRTFVVVRDSSGNLIATQLPSPGPNADPKTALLFIQKHMTNDALIASIRLPERE